MVMVKTRPMHLVGYVRGGSRPVPGPTAVPIRPRTGRPNSTMTSRGWTRVARPLTRTHVAMPSYDRSSSVSSGEDDWRVHIGRDDEETGRKTSRERHDGVESVADETNTGSGLGDGAGDGAGDGMGNDGGGAAMAAGTKHKAVKTTIGDILRGNHPRAWRPNGTTNAANNTILGLKPTNVTAAHKAVEEARAHSHAPRIEIPSNIEDEYLLSFVKPSPMNPSMQHAAQTNTLNAMSPSNTLSPSGHERSTSIKPVLDWLYISQGHLTPMQLADLSSSMALSRIHVIDVGSMNTLKEAIADGVLWMGANRLPSAPVRVAAYLNRLKHRFKQRFNADAGKDNAEGRERKKSIVIMTYSSSASYLTLHALALFFFVYCYMDHSNSRSLAASAVEKQIPPVSILESGMEELAACGKGWLERVQIEWPYGAHSAVDICGEICGGWHVTRHLYYHAARKTWRIQLWGLPPGSYTFKYVVDGEWCVDLKGKMIRDEYGNDNNMATVLACGGLEGSTLPSKSLSSLSSLSSSPPPSLSSRGVVDEMDGMAAGVIPRGRDGLGKDGVEDEGVTSASVAANEYEDEYGYEGVTTAMEGRKMVVVVPEVGAAGPNESVSAGGDAEARTRLARLGSLLLSYYKKIGYV